MAKKCAQHSWIKLAPIDNENQAYQCENCLSCKYEARETYDTVDHPKHYNASPAQCDCGRRIECIDVTRHMNFNLGNSLKYIWRSEHKNGAEDIKKAIWYLNDYLEKLSTDSVEKPVNNDC